MSDSGPNSAEFAEFLRVVEPGLRQALVATYGPIDGREATIDALSWAWEHWDRLADVANPTGYLYRVGQTATRGFAARQSVDPSHGADDLNRDFGDNADFVGVTRPESHSSEKPCSRTASSGR